MNKLFKEEFYEIRNETLEEVKLNSYEWNKFINFWGRNLDNFSVDNILNLYSYNPYGRVFKTFDEWNDDKFERRIKPKSKGIPIINDNEKIYVFDIKQTYGKDYSLWNYNHYIDEFILDLYQNKNNIINKDNDTLNNNFYNTFHTIVSNQIKKNYVDISLDEENFIVRTMLSLFSSRLNFNIYNFPSSYEMLETMENDSILKCMQIANKETNTLFEDFKNNANKLETIQNNIKTTLFSEIKKGNFFNDEEKDNYISNIENNTNINYNVLENIFNKFNERYKNFFKKENDKDIKEDYSLKNELNEEIINNDINQDIEFIDNENNKEQLSLFIPREQELANKICDILNSFDTKYKNTFEIKNLELQKWEHIKSKKRNLTIILSSPIADMGENAFVYFNVDKTDEEKLKEGIENNSFLQSLLKDDDFSISFSPELVHIHWVNFDDKKFDLSLSDEEEINNELNIVQDNDKINYIVNTVELIPTKNGIETNVINNEYRTLEINKKEEKYPALNYHIPDNKIDNRFGAKTRFQDNIKAIELLKELEKENRNATKEEQEILAKYVGWGGISEAFDEKLDVWSTENKMLKELLTEDEYKSARASTLTSFFTPNFVIDSIYKVLEQFGFKKGNLLEPSCAIGNFFGRIPDTLNNSKLYGVEIDNISARIAKKLYPNAKIEISSYEKSKVQDNFFDVAVGNVPFSNNNVYDKHYKEKFKIHDYFFQKTLDKVRTGGIIAFVTSDGTLDKGDTTVRKYIAKRAEFLGAIRLPNNTFEDVANAKTTTDIIFLKKRDGLKLDIDDEKWLYTSKNENGAVINNYYIDNPEMMLGEMTLRATQYGMNNTLNPIETPIDELMTNAINKMPVNIYENVSIDDTEINKDYDILEATDDIKNNSFVIKNINGKDIIYQRIDSDLIPYRVQDGLLAKRIIGLCKIREQVKKLFDMQLKNCTDDELKLEQTKLSAIYDEFVSKYGYINDSANERAFAKDNDYYLLTSLEKIENDENNSPKYVKGDIFTKRTIRKNKEIKNINNAEDGLKCSLNIKGMIDFDYIESIYPKSKEQIIEELGDLIYQDPEKIDEFNGGWVLQSEYLSGNVKHKLNYAKSINVDGKYDRNIKALELVQPTPLEYDEISLKLGSTWIPEDVYHKFCMELLDIPAYYQSNLKIKYAKEINTWLFQASGLYDFGIKNTTTWGTKRADALAIIKNTLNLQTITVYDELENKKKVINVEETANAREKQEMIKQEFKEWVWKDEKRRERLVKIYNDTFNCIRDREYDGSYLTFEGMNPNYELYPHQKIAVDRALSCGKALFAGAVGAGKTYECIASVMELKRLGIINKAMFVVPNSLLGQWANEVLNLYPMANVLVATAKDFESKNRKKLMSRIATGEWDAVIIAHSSFKLIPMSKEYEVKYIENQIEEILTAIEKIKSENNERLSVKKLEQTRKTLEARLTKLVKEVRKDDIVNFEELGVDFLVVDEAHMFKNLPLYSKIRNVSGINNSESQKATDLYMKIRYIMENNNEKGVIFATGTPISNTMGELFVMLKYLNSQRLEELGISNFDEWASTFGEVVNSFEITLDGKGFKTKSRFAQFYNIPELISLFKEVADIKTKEMLNLNVPKLKGGKPIVVVSKQNEYTEKYGDLLVERSERIRNGIDPREDNMLLVTNDGRKIALDIRLMDSTLPDLPNSKINMAVDNIYDIWLETKDKKSTQLVFCDLSTPKEDGSFNVYDDIKNKLIKRDVPSEEIAFIHDAKTYKDRQKLFENVRNGRVRILLGSTSKMGTGVNVQNKIIAMHHLDCPWRPSDIEQRRGRGIRKGNENEEVAEYFYTLEKSVDGYIYQLNETKTSFINQIMKNEQGGRVAEDLDRDTLTYAEIKAIVSGNPLVMEKFKIENELKELYLSKSRYDKNKVELEYKYNKELPVTLKNKEKFLNELQEDISKVEDISGDNFKIILMDKVYNSRKEASTKLYECFSLLKPKEEIKLGEISNFDILGTRDELHYNPIIYIKGLGKYKVEVRNIDEIGNIIKIENVLKFFDKNIDLTKASIENITKQLSDIKEELDKPFQNTDRIRELQKRKAKIDSELDLDKQENMRSIEDIDENEMER